MIAGQVNGTYEAVIPIQMLGSDRQLEVVIDTGFRGAHLVLPRAVIAQMRLPRRARVRMGLANEQTAEFNSYDAEIIWHDRPLTVIVLESENDYLASATLLAGSRITIDLTPGGAVTVDELPLS